MMTHPSILAWKIPWTEDPGRLKSLSSQKNGEGGGKRVQDVYLWWIHVDIWQN